MLNKIDVHQVITLSRFALKAEWRTTGLRAVGRKRSGSKWWVVWNLISYVVLGGILSRFYKGNVEGQALLLANAVIMTYIGVVAASNIFLSFGTGFLSPDETQIIIPLPVSSETFFFSRLAVLLCYTTIISVTVAFGPAIAIFLLRGQDVGAAIGLLLSAILAGITSGLTVIVLYGLILPHIPREKMARVTGYAQFVGSLVTTGSIVILANFDRVIGLGDYTLRSHSWLSAIPGVWFGALASILAGSTEGPMLVLALGAFAFLALVSAGAHILLGKTYQSAVSELSGAVTTAAPTRKISREPFLFRWFSKLLGSHEARAVLMLFRAQFRFDTRFRMSVLSVLPLTLIYLIVAVVSGGVADPFRSSFKDMLNAELLYMIALLMPLMLLQSISQSDSFRSSWIFFASPLDRSKLLLAVRNTLYAWVILPYLIILAVAFCFFMPIVHAVMHVVVLGTLATMVFQIFLMVSPKMPFAQQRKPNRNNFATTMGIMFLSAGSIFALGLTVHFGYRSITRYATALAVLVTLMLLLEQGLKARLRSKLAQEEFDA